MTLANASRISKRKRRAAQHSQRVQHISTGDIHKESADASSIASQQHGIEHRLQGTSRKTSSSFYLSNAIEFRDLHSPPPALKGFLEEGVYPVLGPTSISPPVAKTSPSLECVLDILDAAAECNSKNHAEDSWNSEVHCRILDAALRPHGEKKFSHLVNFMHCSTASLITNYVPSTVQSRKVDFCIYIEPSNASEEDVVDAISSLRESLPASAFNHTNYPALSGRPIVCSIETKRADGKWKDAKAQLGTLLAAHWGFLQRLVINQQQGGVHAMLPDFLPGIIAHGHEWHLLLSTIEGPKPVIWETEVVVSTRNVQGIYQIICLLQLLRRWAIDVYWPWLRDCVLRPANDDYD